jgi:predicted metal-binding membrane protein
VSAQLTRLEAALRRDRMVILAGITMLALVTWAYLVYLAWEMGTMDHQMAMDMTPGMVMPHMQSWGAIELLLLIMMWAVMMVAMMIPSVAPLILIFARANRQKGSRRVVGSAGILLLGYLLVWLGFGAIAALVQWWLHSAALLSPMMKSTNPVLGGLLLAAAGVFQFTPLKRACLTRCRSPLTFLMSDWRAGQWGALVMGLKHGAYCVGCCWLLMTLLFVAGVMNLLWVALIAVLVLVEKIAPRGDLIGRCAGVALIVVGIALGVTPAE